MPGHEGEAEQPAGLAAEARVEQAQRRRSSPPKASAAPATARPARAERLRPAGLAGQPPEAVVAEDQRQDAVVARARDPRAVGGRASGRSAAATRRRRRPSRRRRRAAGAARARRPRGATHSHAAASAGHDQQRRAPSWSRSRARRTRRRARASACGRPRARARRTTARATQQRISSASGLLWREIATAIGVEREHEAGDEARRAAEAPPRQVVDERDGRDAHQRLRHEDGSADGSRRPRADSACTHSASGGLSTVITPAASNEP